MGDLVSQSENALFWYDRMKILVPLVDLLAIGKPNWGWSKNHSARIFA